MCPPLEGELKGEEKLLPIFAPRMIPYTFDINKSNKKSPANAGLHKQYQLLTDDFSIEKL